MNKFIAIFTASFLLFTQETLAIELSNPLACDMENNCFIQTYVDHSSAPHTQKNTDPAKDFSCGPLAKKGYWATDFRVTYYNPNKAPAVLAAADGKVIAIRRTMPDSIHTTYTPYQIPLGKEAGNSIIIKHESGFETQYNHLKFGSILVAEGQNIKQGEKIAEVGSSGRTVLPKLGFSVRENGLPVDPFSYGTVWACGNTDASLWKQEIAHTFNYKETGIARAGFSEHIPEAAHLRTGLGIKQVRRISPESIIFWADFYGIQKDDIIYMRIQDPTGQLFAEQESIARTDYPVWLGYVGRKNNTGALTSGIYTAEVLLQRNGTHIILSQLYEIEIEGDRLPPSKPIMY